MKKIIFSFLRFFVSGALILILLYIMRDRYAQILTVLKSVNLPIFLLALATFISAITIASLRLKLIISAQDMQIRFSEAFSLTFIGYFFNNFLPTAIGGDVVKAYYLSKKTREKMASFTAIFIDRIIGLLTMIFMAFAALLFVNGTVIDNRLRYAIYAITVMSLLALVFLTNKKFAKKFSVLLKLVRPIEHKLVEAYNTVHKYKHHSGLIIRAFVISIVSQSFFFTSLGILVWSIGSSINISQIFLRMPIIGVVSLLPSINGLGLREGSTVVFFGPLIGKTNAFAVSVLWLFALLIVSVIGGAIYALSPQFKVDLKKIMKEP